jgi:GTP-binding protein
MEARDHGSLPPLGPQEIAIAGRSNVGKSTMLNRLSGRRLLARTSKTPGRTRGVIFYNLQCKMPEGHLMPLRIADLPGYGYAKVSKGERFGWGALIEYYIENARSLSLVVVLVDARRELDIEDHQLLEWLDAIGRPFVVVVTKIDKLTASERGLCTTKIAKSLGPIKCRVLAVSGETGEGMDRLWPVLVEATRVQMGEPT